MSDSVDWIVDLEAGLDEGQTLAAKVHAWLAEQGIVSTVPCEQKSYGGGDLLLPGAAATATAWAASGWSPGPVAMVGYAAVIGRRVFDTGGNGLQSLCCPRCGHLHDPDALPWFDAVQAWAVQEGDDALTCPACSNKTGIVDWRFGEFEWAFGNLAFAFWNWPVTENLAQHIGALLGHRVRLVHRHI